ncbi:MAG: hypothetical protein IPP15_11315 [Saprospiraceae bacterium]|uniref:Uncharacterized protein n=1 Tax=Candidatus Opimibacter skivensis TaxID=2982028 RepID=A0A9D7XTU2_9BACT|nr:hypothetical protein [Candidatus Opimibacter skivensis]
MKQSFSYSSLIQQCLVALIFMASISLMNAQANSSLIGSANGLSWKDKLTIEQIVQQEITKTTSELSAQGLTDWSTAMLEAYKSLLLNTQAGMHESDDMPYVLDKAFVQMQNEPVQNPESRKMVLDDMKAKQVELIQKLTNQ